MKIITERERKRGNVHYMCALAGEKKNFNTFFRNEFCRKKIFINARGKGALESS